MCALDKYDIYLYMYIYIYIVYKYHIYIYIYIYDIYNNTTNNQQYLYTTVSMNFEVFHVYRCGATTAGAWPRRFAQLAGRRHRRQGTKAGSFTSALEVQHL